MTDRVRDGRQLMVQDVEGKPSVLVPMDGLSEYINRPIRIGEWVEYVVEVQRISDQRTGEQPV